MNKRTIGECFYQIRNGANIKQGMVEGGFPITRIETIANDKFNRDRMGYAGITDAEKYKKYILEDGDLLMSHINSAQYLGRTVLYKKNGDEKIIHGMNLLGLKANREIIEPAYAKYYFYSKPFREQINRITKKSVNQASFAVADLKRLTILVPPLSKQHEVVDVLDKINKIITFRQQQLAKLDELVKARFIEMFGKYENGTTTVFMEDVSEMITVGIANSATHAYAENGVIMFRNQNIKEGFLDDSDLIYITEEFASKYKTKQLKENDLLITRTGYPGIACIVPKKYEGTQTFTTLIVRLKNSGRVMACYACNYINSYYGKRYVESMKAGVAQQNFGAKALDKMPIFIPPMDEQIAFENFVERSYRTKLILLKGLEQMETLKKALMQQYFG